MEITVKRSKWKRECCKRRVELQNTDQEKGKQSGQEERKGMTKEQEEENWKIRMQNRNENEEEKQHVPNFLLLEQATQMADRVADQLCSVCVNMQHMHVLWCTRIGKVYEVD